MEQAVAIFFLVLVVVIKGATMYWTGQKQRALADAESANREAQQRLDALDATRTQLERDNKIVEKDVEQLENDKNALLVEIQKHGVRPIAEPKDDELTSPHTVPADRTSSPPPGENGETGGGADPPPGGEGGDAEHLAENGHFNGNATPAPAPDDEKSDSRPRILVVDDNVELLDLLRRALGTVYRVESASDGLEALNVVIKEKRAYDLIITDLNMPNVDGITFLQHLPERIPTIVISAYLDRPEFADALKKIGPSGVLEKPFRLNEVKAAIERALGQPTPESPSLPAPPSLPEPAVPPEPAHLPDAPTSPN